MKTRKPKIKIIRDVAGEFRFSVVAANGEIVCQSEAYTTRSAAKRGAQSLVAAVLGTLLDLDSE
jgi:uncharacterized protein YegP (UPF0339 family)